MVGYEECFLTNCKHFLAENRYCMLMTSEPFASDVELPRLYLDPAIGCAEVF
jgi:hypothetical protein